MVDDAEAAQWDGEAATFDEAPDHGLRDVAVREAWRTLLQGALPPAPSRVADLGCGTGTLSLLLAEAGHAVDGVDVSPRMLEVAEHKAGATNGVLGDVRFRLGDAADPPLAAGAYDVVLCRHVLWALPEPVAALRRWAALLAPGGRLVLVEGRWWNGAGLPAGDTLRLLANVGRAGALTVLDDPALWGRPIDDERYLVVSEGGGTTGPRVA